jgi:hypothetical protein
MQDLQCLLIESSANPAPLEIGMHADNQIILPWAIGPVRLTDACGANDLAINFGNEPLEEVFWGPGTIAETQIFGCRDFIGPKRIVNGDKSGILFNGRLERAHGSHWVTCFLSKCDRFALWYEPQRGSFYTREPPFG